MTSRKSMGLPLNRANLPCNHRAGRPNMGGVKKPRRYRPGTVALREIRKYQTTTDTLIPKIAFQRLTKEIMCAIRREQSLPMLRIQSTALLALQTAAEQHLVDMFSKSQLLAIHGKRITVQPKDVQIVRFLIGDSDSTESNQN